MKQDEMVETLQLLKVEYGSDTGLVSLEAGILVMSTWDTSRVSVMSPVPVLVVEDYDMHELHGDEHNWNDVISMLQKHYAWDSKVLPDMAELRKHYPPRDDE